KINVGKPDSGDQRNILQKVKDYFDLNKIARENEKKEKEEQKQYLKDIVTLNTKVDSPEPKKKWTTLYYFDGNNNLDPMGRHQFSSLTQLGSDKNTNLVGLYSGFDADGKKTSAERGLIEKSPAPKSSRRVDTPSGGRRVHEAPFFPGSEKVGQLDMGDPKTLQDFIKWGMKKYPAEHYALVLWDHGAGFMGSMVDEKTNNIIDNKELAGVLKNVSLVTRIRLADIDFVIAHGFISLL
ncbi:MAG: clostripain-related cysteine peptidase, partial [Firmicutes bacterium]|nr:clostripain-related cysteine peptidase [Bacillota bacterium]